MSVFPLSNTTSHVVTAIMAASLGFTVATALAKNYQGRGDPAKDANPQPTVRLYTAMSCDLTHYGHYDLLKRGIDMLRQRLAMDAEGVAGKNLPRIVMVVGICSDATVEAYKRRPILTLTERAAAMRHCRHCDEVIEDAPAITDAAFMKLHSLDYIVTGGDYTQSSLAKWFPEASRRGVCLTAPYSDGISTSDIIRRCQAAAPVVKSNIH